MTVPAQPVVPGTGGGAGPKPATVFCFIDFGPETLFDCFGRFHTGEDTINRKHDYEALEREYVTSDISLRALAKKAGIANHSMLIEQSTKNGWVQKRADYRAKANQKAVTLLANDEAKRIARESEVRDHAIDAIDEAIQRLRADLADTVKTVSPDGEVIDTGVPVLRVKPQDVAILIDRLQVLFGKPSAITEERKLGIELETNDPAILKGIIEATRGMRDGPAGPARSALPRIEGAGPN